MSIKKLEMITKKASILKEQSLDTAQMGKVAGVNGNGGNGES